MSEQKETSRVILLLRAIRDSLRHNMGYKILALVLAIALWAGLITQDPNLTREKVMHDAAITINGAATLENRGLVITAGLEDIETVEIRADVPQRQYQTVTGSQYRPTIDLSRITEAGVQEVPITTNNATTYGSVISVSPSSIRLTVEQIKTNNRVRVTPVVEGNLAEGWILNSYKYDLTGYVTVTGPASLVDQVYRVQLVLNQADIDTSKTTDAIRCDLRPVDRSGTEVSSDQLEIRYDGLKIETGYMDIEIQPIQTENETSEAEE